MRIRDGQPVFSPSDLNVFLESPFASWMDRFHLQAPATAPVLAPDARGADMALLSKMGDAHERAYLDRLIREGHDVWQPPAAAIASRDTDAKVEATLAAMRAGREILFQATLRHDGFEGHADFLRRVDTPSPLLGAFHYEVLDTKLARSPKPYFLLQLCAYAEMLEAIQGIRPRDVHVVNGASETLPFRTDDYFFFYRMLKRAFLEHQKAFDPASRPVPEARADHGRWQSAADAHLMAIDHPSRVAGITKHQISKLSAGGIRTLAELAATTVDRVAHMDAQTFGKLRAQARLQLDSADRATPLFEVIVPAEDDPARGLALLPPPSALDVFFDMEGYPLAEGGLEYLFGSMVIESDRRVFVDFWAHDKVQEKRAFEAFVDWAYARFERDPSMHVYHYAPYEVTALKRLASTYGTREQQLDDLLRAEVFVDLYRIVRQGVRIGEPRYSLKNVEHLYRPARSGEVSNAGQSVVEYARWLETPDGHDHTSSAILGSIRDYNLDDCESTLQLAEWLRERQREAQIAYVPPAGNDEAKSDTLVQRDDELYAARLLQQIPAEPEARAAEAERWRLHELLAHLVVFHRREDKPFWWNIFEKAKATHEELREDTECLGDLVRIDEPARKEKRSFLHDYRFDPRQETKVEGGTSCFIADSDELASVHVESVDLETGIAVLKAGPNRTLPERMSLIPGEYIKTAKIAASIRRTAETWETKRELSGALSALLRREPPRIHGHRAGEPLLRKDEELVEGTVRIIRAMRGTTLAIQGPPGAGKTTAASHAILALIQDGKRVGITSNSHKAIEKLMEDVLILAKTTRKRVRATKIGGDRTADVVEKHGAAWVESLTGVELEGRASAQLVGATAWKLADEPAFDLFDHLFVDEAGQVSLANLVGMAPSADNLVLLGDQMQLSQPTQAAHPGQSGMSALDYLLEGQTTIRPEQGIFLAKTWRLHPSLCSFISGAFYDDRLTPEACTGGRVVRAAPLTNASEAGLRFIGVSHEESSQCSEEEADAVEVVVAELLARQLVLEDGSTRALTANDILVVAPYNLQVRLLRRRLPELRIASVDKFQGQQAAVVILSMCASSGEGSPRGLEFLFSPNRLNVAISRAQSLAVVVGSPALASARVTSIKQMKLVNLYCRILLEAHGA